MRGSYALFLAAFPAVACGHVTADPAAGGDHDAAHDSSTAPKCGDHVVRIAEWLPEVPDAPIGFQIPTIGVSGDDLFYLLNWDPGRAAAASPGGLVMRVPIRGGAPVRIADVVGSGNSSGRGFAVTRSAVVFSQGDNNPGGVGAIVSVPTMGGVLTTLARTSRVAHAVVANETSVFFVDAEGVKSVSVAGGSVRTLTTQSPYSIMVAGGVLYLAEYGGAKTLSSVPVGGGPVTVLVTDLEMGMLVPVLCGPNLCWLSASVLNSSLKQVALSGGVPSVLAGGLSYPRELLFDGVNFFLTAGNPIGAVLRVPASGGELVSVGSQNGLDLALDESCLYWSNLNGIYSLSLSAADAADGSPL